MRENLADIDFSTVTIPRIAELASLPLMIKEKADFIRVIVINPDPKYLLPAGFVFDKPSAKLYNERLTPRRCTPKEPYSQFWIEYLTPNHRHQLSAGAAARTPFKPFDFTYRYNYQNF